MEKFDKVYDKILNLAVAAINSEDPDEQALLKDMTDMAYTYTGYRLNDNFLTREQRNNTGEARTRCHNRFMDTLMIFLRYENILGKEIPDLSNYDRKTLGDIGNKLVADIAILQR